MTPFEYGQIKAHMHHGLGPAAISEMLCKCDGQHPSVEQVSQAVTKLRDDPSWRGERAEGAGRHYNVTAPIETLLWVKGAKTSEYLLRQVWQHAQAPRGPRGLSWTGPVDCWFLPRGLWWTVVF